MRSKRRRVGGSLCVGSGRGTPWSSTLKRSWGVGASPSPTTNPFPYGYLHGVVPPRSGSSAKRARKLACQGQLVLAQYELDQMLAAFELGFPELAAGFPDLADAVLNVLHVP